MSTKITLTLPDEIYHQAQQIAQKCQRNVADILVETLESVLSPNPKPISALSDSEVMALTQLRMQPDREHRLNELLDRQQSDTIAPNERSELQALIHIYEDKLLRQAQALNEAVRRGLLEPLQG